MRRVDALREIEEIVRNPLKPIARWKESSGAKVVGCLACMPPGLSEQLAEWKACLVAATYADSWCARIYSVEPSTPVETVYKEIAKAYLVPYINSNFDHRVELLKGMVEKYQANGFLMHSDRSCKPYSLGQYVIRDEVTRETGVPGLVIEADMNDSRQWAEAPTLTRIQAYLETLSNAFLALA